MFKINRDDPDVDLILLSKYSEVLVTMQYDKWKVLIMTPAAGTEHVSDL